MVHGYFFIGSIKRDSYDIKFSPLRFPFNRGNTQFMLIIYVHRPGGVGSNNFTNALQYCVGALLENFLFQWIRLHTHTHMCVCVCVCRFIVHFNILLNISFMEQISVYILLPCVVDTNIKVCNHDINNLKIVSSIRLRVNVAIIKKV